MLRKIIQIDAEKCNGCGACARACHEGAIGMVNGKAKLLRDDYCDGLGDCLPACPADAIHFVEREAAAYDAAAVAQRRGGKPHACPGSAARTLIPSQAVGGDAACASALTHWPVQLQLAPVSAPVYAGAHLLVAADCTAYAYGNFHADFMRGRTVLVGCPKLDPVDYAPKLEAILSGNDIADVTVVRMEVPCCGGLEYAVKTAAKNCGKDIPVRVVTLAVDGHILE